MRTKELEKLKSKLPRKWRTELWRRLGKYSISAINQVMRGDYNNDEIIDAALGLAEEHQATLKARKEKLSSL
jgi:DNA replication protein DnaD